MITKIIKIGNSRGIRIPKAILEQTGLGEQVQLEVENGQIILRPADPPRKGWKKFFRQMHEKGDDDILNKDHITTSWDEKEWEW